ncbi:MAG: glutamine-hydrolyzing carbamoyl-phosphate synthase small subunit, partial [Pseudomonadota bacterium]
INFTFPHIGNIGTNDEDNESYHSYVHGCLFNNDVTIASNYRSQQNLDEWLLKRSIPAMFGLCTRSLTHYIRSNKAPNGILSTNMSGQFDLEEMAQQLASWPGLKGADLARQVSCKQKWKLSAQNWKWSSNLRKNNLKDQYHVIAIDYGIKYNIIRLLHDVGCKVEIVPADTSSESILAHNPDGIFLSNGPGDPASTEKTLRPTIKKLIEYEIPIFGICLGQQILALSLGGRTKKMQLGHHGANHPIFDDTTQKVEITSQNHGFVVEEQSLPKHIKITHRSLFDHTIAGFEVKDKPIFAVQYHPEASPGPQDSHYLFQRFASLMQTYKDTKAQKIKSKMH